jgi:hypothetical protein
VLLALSFGVGIPLLAVGSALSYGGSLANGPIPAGESGAVVTGVAVVGLYLGGAGGFNQESAGSVGSLVRTSIPPRAVALGRLVSETAQAAVVVVPPGVALLALVGVGAGQLLPPVLLALAVLPVLVASVLVGRVGGDALRYANRRVGLSLWTKALLFLVTTTAIYAGTQVILQSYFDDSAEAASVSIPAFLPGEPLQAYALVALDPLGAAGHPFGLAVAGVVLGTVPLALAVALRAEARLLAIEAGTAATAAGGTRGVPGLFRLTTGTRVAWRYLLRVRRDPRMLAHLSPLLFGAMAILASAVTDPGSLLVLGPSAAVVGGATLAGAAFCLNPLGDDSEQLPLLLTSAHSVAGLLRGRALAGAIPGLAIGVGVGTPLAVYQHGPVLAVGQTVLAVALTAAATGTALGLGALVPKFERREYMNVERAHPSNVAVLGFFFGGLIVGAAGFALLFWTLGGVSLPLVAFGWALYLVVLVVPAGVGYVFAVRKFEAVTLDDI